MPRASHRRRGDHRTTSERGYDYEHRQTRKALVPAAIGTVCPLGVSPKCVGVMTSPKHMDLDHSHALALGGRRGDRIVCSPCNRTAGARLGNRLRRMRRRATTVQRRSFEL